MADNALRASESSEEATQKLYGPVLISGRSISVYLGSCAKPKNGAACSLYWGDKCRWNKGFKFEGPQTEARSALFGVLQAIMECAGDRTLIIYTTSEYAIRSFCYWAGKNASSGWPCMHSDVLKETALRIQGRWAPVEF
ncbi:hypothetical protein DFH06DRAFT_1017517, partial [Mycena polygramma]